MLTRFPLALTHKSKQVIHEKLLNKIRQITYSLDQSKEITKNVFKNIMNSIRLWNRMDTAFMNSGNSETSDLILTDYYSIFRTK